jgi:hypothetical protein
LKMLAVCVALSTALIPFTLVEPPANGLMASQPARSGWQLTVGIVATGARTSATGTRGRSNGRALALSRAFADRLSVCLAVRCAVDGVANGPVSR